MADERPRRVRRERDEQRAPKSKTRPAEKRSSDETRGSEKRSSDKTRGSDGNSRRPRRRQVPGAKLALHARQELAEITGLRAEGVSALEQLDDGTWLVTVELLELSRIPESDDVIGSYETEFDENGELLSYRRVRRYPRSQAGREQTVGGG